VLALLWVLFIFMLLQIPSFSSENLAKVRSTTMTASGPFFFLLALVCCCAPECALLALIYFSFLSSCFFSQFDPYEILAVDKGASGAAIKKAYRKQSLLYHPDVNSSPEATQQFMLVAKAYQTLTSESAKANIEKYGNPDGYQGVSVTIGLPSILTRKENEMRVLVLYFFLFIALPPIVVWVWWRRAREFVDGGTMKKTLAMWAQLMLPNQGSKQLVEFLAIAAEFETIVDPVAAAQKGAAAAGISASAPSGPQALADMEEFKKLAAEVKPHQFKPRFAAHPYRPYFIAYATRASVLLHAYLLRLKIPSETMKVDLMRMLKDAHRLLNVMMELAWARGFVQTVFGVFDLQQLITQGLFAHDSPLLQLPHLTAVDCRKLAHKNIRTVLQVLKAPPEKLAKILPDLSASQWADIRSTAELIPDVSVKHSYAVEDEEGLFEGDLVTLKVTLERQSFDPDKPDPTPGEQSVNRVSKHEGGEDSASSSSVAAAPTESAASEGSDDKTVAASAVAAKQSKDKSNKAKFAAAAAASASVAEKKEDGSSVGGEEKKEDGGASAEDSKSDSPSAASSSPSSPSASPLAPMTDDEILDSLPHPVAAPAVPDLLQSGPSVHSLTFPFPKHEKWTVLLLEKSAKKADKLIGVVKVPSFFDEANVELRFLAPRFQSAKELGLSPADATKAGMVQYELHAVCDSYVGVDVVRPFSIKVERMRHASAEEHAKAIKEKVKSEYAALEDDGEPELDEQGNVIPRAEGLGGMLRQALEGGNYDDGKWSAAKKQ
jgi:translocation protein SEC63